MEPSFKRSVIFWPGVVKKGDKVSIDCVEYLPMLSVQGGVVKGWCCKDKRWGFQVSAYVGKAEKPAGNEGIAMVEKNSIDGAGVVRIGFVFNGYSHIIHNLPAEPLLNWTVENGDCLAFQLFIREKCGTLLCVELYPWREYGYLVEVINAVPDFGVCDIGHQIDGPVVQVSEAGIPGAVDILNLPVFFFCNVV